MAIASTFTINFRTVADLLGLNQVQTSLNQLHGGLEGTKTKVREASASADAFKNSLIGGFVGGAAVAAISTLTNSLASIPRAFAAAVNDGIKFNATLQTSQLGIAAIIKQFDRSGRFKDFDAALDESAKAIDLLKEKALQSPATFEQLVAAFQGVSGAASAANIPLKRQVDLVVLMSQALAGLGIRSDQILQESRALLTGNITEDAMAAKILGITKAQVEQAKSEGQLFEFLSEKLGAFREAGIRGMDTYTTQTANLSDALQQLKGVATADLFKLIIDGLRSINGLLADPTTTEKARGIGAVMADWSERSARAAERMRDFGAAFSKIPLTLPWWMAKAGGGDTFDKGAAQQFRESAQARLTAISEEIRGAQTLEQKVRALIDLDVERIALAGRLNDKNALIRQAAQDLLGKVSALGAGFEVMAGSAASTAHSMSATADEVERAMKSMRALQDIRTQIANTRLEATGQEGNDLAGLRSKTIEKLTASGVSQIDAVREAEELVGVTMQKLDYQAEERRKREAGSGGGGGGGGGEAIAGIDALTAAKTRLTGAEQSYQTALEQTRLLEEGGLITSEQAQSRNIEATRAYLAELERVKATLPELIAQQQALGNTEGVAELTRQLEQIKNKALEAQIALQNTTVFGQMRAQIRSLAAEWGNVGKQVGGFLTQQFQNFASTASAAITGLIFRTGNWKQAILSIGQSFVQSMIQMVIQWVLSRTIMSVLNKAFGAADAAATNLQASAAAAAWAPAATAASIASYGAASGAGLAAYLAAIATGSASTIAAAGAGFRLGGFTGSGSDDDIAGPAHRNEFYFSAPAVRTIGRGVLENLHNVALTRPDYASTGGGRGSGAGSGAAFGRSQKQETAVFPFIDMDLLRKKLLESRASEKIVVDIIRGRRIDLGF